jgi:hypothetical protein
VVVNRFQAFAPPKRWIALRTTYELRPRDVGRPALPSGWIVAADPEMMLDIREPFRTRVAPGTYPVQISIAKPIGTVWDDEARKPESAEGFEADRSTTEMDQSERVAFARLQFSLAPVESWDLAETIDTFKRRIPIDDLTGFGVDSGTGCLIDVRDKEAWIAHCRSGDHESGGETQRLIDEAANCKGLACVARFDGRRHIALFRSGMGDGVYECWWGLDEQRQPCQLVIDFNIGAAAPHYGRSPRRWWRTWYDRRLRKRAGY